MEAPERNTIMADLGHDTLWPLFSPVSHLLGKKLGHLLQLAWIAPSQHQLWGSPPCPSCLWGAGGGARMGALRTSLDRMGPKHLLSPERQGSEALRGLAQGLGPNLSFTICEVGVLTSKISKLQSCSLV